MSTRRAPAQAMPRGRPRAPAAQGDGAGTGTGACVGADSVPDTRFLETLVGYNARRAALAVIGVFLRRMAPFALRPVDFSVLTLIAHNPGVTSRQICNALDILPPNLVGLVKGLQERGLVQRRPHPSDRRAQGLHLTDAGERLHRQAQAAATELEAEATAALSADEVQTLIALLRKLYRPGTEPGIGDTAL